MCRLLFQGSTVYGLSFLQISMNASPELYLDTRVVTRNRDWVDLNTKATVSILPRCLWV